MGRGKKLSACEVHTALKLIKEKYSIAKIAKILKRSRNVISKLVKNPDNYGKKKSSGRSPALNAACEACNFKGSIEFEDDR